MSNEGVQVRSYWGFNQTRRLSTPRLKRLFSRQGNRTNPGISWKAILVGSVIATLFPSGVLPSAVWAETAKLGVVKSSDNEGYWSEITTRLQATGVDYCIIDFSQVQQVSDLGSPKLLFLPNIERLEAPQLTALQEWMRQGGRVIVSGPAGTLSQPEIRNRLRTLLGAYWGFDLKQPSGLKPVRTAQQTWVPSSDSTGNIRGGVIIPRGLTSSTAAVWSQRDNSPAVVSNNQSIFLGWRWGVDVMVPPAVDTAWLQAALRRYDIPPTPSPGTSTPSQPYCVPSQASATQRPLTSLPSRNRPNPATVTPRNTSASDNTPTRIAEVDPDFGVAPAQVLPNSKGPLTAAQVSAMSQELQNLIGRVESALLTANATNSNVNLPTSAAIEQFLRAGAKGDSRPEDSQTPDPTMGSNPTIRAVVQARMGLQNFLNAIAQNDYDGARQHWFQARRTLWDNYPIDRNLTQPEIRAIWLDRGTIVRAKSEQDLANVFDQLAAAGFNTVFFETVNASYPIYPSRVAPEQNPLVKGWDPLAAAVKLAHQRGMELHAWVWMFAAANQRHNTLLNQPATYPGPVLKALPGWAMFDQRGRLFDPNTKKAFLDPANPQVRQYLIALLEEIVTRYEVDGIQLDYIRYPFQDPKVNQTFGYGKAARQQFKELTGVDPIQVSPNQRDLWQKWTDFRVRQIDSFVTTVSTRLRKQRPSLILSAAVFPLPRQERLQKLQQNWEDWAIRGDIDLVVPMTYALDTMGLDRLAQPVLMQSTLSSTLMLPAIRLLNLPTIVAIDQMQHLRDSSSSGYALFAVENLDQNLQNVFRRTQSGGENVRSTPPSPIPYRQPFPAAAARYQALQREWSFLLANHQLLLPEPVLSEWGKQADMLSSLLNQLTKEPSTQNLLSAKAYLVSFRSQFQRWMQSQSAIQPYQVQVWDNRLASIERLLRYGERTLSKPN
ncbi:MAG TPA: family 10 glycosylhydrolase [Stenomitos sp.]